MHRREAMNRERRINKKGPRRLAVALKSTVLAGSLVDPGQGDVDVATGGIGIRAHLVSLFY